MNFEMLLAAKKNLQGVIKETPLIYSRIFSSESGNDVYMKAENLQITGAFKLRGAYNKICTLSHDQRERGLIAASAGNHAQGVAYSAKALGVQATIVMPIHTPLIKVEATRDYGAQVVLSGNGFDEAYQHALKLAQEKGYTFVHPFDDEEVIAGQGTIGLEIVEELKDVDAILVPIGGGGLIAGVAMAAKLLKPSVRIIGVEPDGAKAMKLSMEQGHVVALEQVNTIAEGVAVKRPGEKAFALVKEYVDEIITVTDVDIMEAFLVLLEKEKLVAENAGVLSLAALKKLDVKGQKLVSLISGGNIDVVTISELINRGLIIRGRVFCFSVELSDTPGELVKISRILAEHRANVIQLEHNQFKTIDRFKQVHLEVSVETNGHAHIREIKESLESNGYAVHVIY